MTTRKQHSATVKARVAHDRCRPQKTQCPHGIEGI